MCILFLGAQNLRTQKLSVLDLEKSWNGDLQKVCPKNMRMRINYVGKRSNGLWGSGQP